MIEKINTTSRRNTSAAIICLLLTAISLNACKKDNDEPCPSECLCEEFPPAMTVQGYTYADHSNRVLQAQFNPNHDSEFAYYKTNSSEEGVYIYNTNTQESTLVYEGYVKYGPEWGVNDWILLNLGDNNIYKIKSDGTELTQLTFDGDNYYPHWNLTADSILYNKAFGNITILMNENGETLDTLPDWYNKKFTVWNHPTHLAASFLDEQRIVEMSDLNESTIHYFSSDFILYDGCEPNIESSHGRLWVGDDIYYSHTLGVFKVNMDGTGETMIKEGCSSIIYRSPSVNQSKDKLLWVKTVSEHIGNNTIKITNSVVQMDLDGQNEMEIEIE
jgi:hypothetical protein